MPVRATQETSPALVAPWEVALPAFITMHLVGKLLSAHKLNEEQCPKLGCSMTEEAGAGFSEGPSCLGSEGVKGTFLVPPCRSAGPRLGGRSCRLNLCLQLYRRTEGVN